MAINLCRNDPKRIVPNVREAYKTNVLLAGGLGKKQLELIMLLQRQAQLPQVRFDEQANQAVRANNEAVVAQESDAPPKGGNIAKYTEISGSDKSSSCSEFTMIKFTGDKGMDFVALQLSLDFEGMNPGVKPIEAPAAPTGAATDNNAPAEDTNAGANARKAPRCAMLLSRLPQPLVGAALKCK